MINKIHIEWSLLVTELIGILIPPALFYPPSALRIFQNDPPSALCFSMILCPKRPDCKYFLGVPVSETVFLMGVAANSVSSAQWAGYLAGGC